MEQPAILREMRATRRAMPARALVRIPVRTRAPGIARDPVRIAARLAARITGHPAPVRMALGLPVIRLGPARALQTMRRAMELLLAAIPWAEAAAALRTAGRRTTALRMGAVPRTGPQMIRLRAAPVPTMLLTTVSQAALRTARPMGLMPTIPQIRATVRRVTLHPTILDRMRIRR